MSAGDPAHESTGHDSPGDTSGQEYADRLRSLQGKWWKRLLPVQAPYRWNIRRLHLGRTLDVGCGIGRNLAFLDEAVGVDHNAASIRIARSRGLEAYTPDEFIATPHAASATFDSLLFAHVLEHMPAPAGYSLVERYLPYLKRDGRICFITPQERGFAFDPTHVEYLDLDALSTLATRLGFVVERAYSFPFPRWAGRSFVYNEFVLVAGRR